MKTAVQRQQLPQLNPRATNCYYKAPLINRQERSYSEKKLLSRATLSSNKQSELQQLLYNPALTLEDRFRLQRLMENHEKIHEIIFIKNESLNNRSSIMRPVSRALRIQTEKEASPHDSEVVNFDEFTDQSEVDSSESELTPRDNKEITKVIRSIHQRLSNQIRGSFFSYIKQKDKLKDIAQNFSNKDANNPIYYYCQNDDLFPKRIEISNILIDDKELDLSQIRITPQYMPVIQNLIKSEKCKYVKIVTVRNNVLFPQLLHDLLQSFSGILKTLSLSNNEIGKKGAEVLTKQLENFQNLKVLQVTNNQLGDVGGSILLTRLGRNNILIKLSLAQNQFSDGLSPSLLEFLQNNVSVEEIDLSWNQLGPNSGTSIAKGLMQNRSIRVLDLSYNRLGMSTGDCISAFCDAIVQHSFSVTHLDLAYNQLSESQLRQLAVHLEKNQTLFGLHIDGNKSQAFVDPYGFIQFPKEQDSMKKVHRKKFHIDGVNFQLMDQENMGNDCCWICQGWSEQRFQYVPKSSTFNDPIFLHLDFLQYKPIPMTTSFEIKAQLVETMKVGNKTLDLTTGEIIHQLKLIVDQDKKISMAAIEEAYKQGDGGRQERADISKELMQELDKFYYTTLQMCPPSKQILYFYSNPLKEEYFIDPDQPNMPVPIDNLILQGKDLKHQIHSFSDGTQIQFKRVQQVNFLECRQQFIIDDRNNYKPLIRLLPRSSEKKYVIRRMDNKSNRKKLHIADWHKEDSVFRSFQGDSKELLDQCFEFDWECSRIPRFIKNEYEKLKFREYLRQYYPLIKDLYRYYSSQGFEPPNCDIFCIQFPQCIKLFNVLGWIDGECLKMQDIEIDLVSTKNNPDPRYIYNPDKGLVRYQFMEMLFRVSNDRFIRTNQSKNYADAILRSLKELKSYFCYFDTLQAWRDERFWNRQCDLVLTFKTPFLKKLYDFVTDITNRKWYFRLKWVSVREFKEFCKVCSFNLTERQQVIIYNFSMQTQVDELTQDRNIRMNYFEFLESLGRIAERLSPAPVGESYDYWPALQRELLPLNVKLESLLTFIYYKLNAKITDFEQFSMLFHKYKPDAPASFADSMPKLVDKKKKAEEVFKLNNLNTLTVYNSITYFAENQMPYLNPKYRIFLRQPVPPVQPDTSQGQQILPGQKPKLTLPSIKRRKLVELS